MSSKYTVKIPVGSSLSKLNRQGSVSNIAPLEPPQATKVSKAAEYIKIKKRPFFIKSGIPKITQIEEYLTKYYDFRYDTVMNEIECKEKNENLYHTVNENNLILELMKVGFKNIEKEVLFFLNSDYVAKYDPFKAYFDNLPPWNGTTDHIAALASYVKAKDKEWFNQQFKKMLVRCVAGSTKAIPFNKHCFVLMSGQNDGKSTFLRFLCPKPLRKYYTESIEIDNKDGRLALCQNFFITLDELSKHNKKDVNTLKSFISQSQVKDRLPYGKKPVSFERRANFLGSTNKGEFLTDETGNVRWLIFEIEGIQHDNGKAKGYDKNIDMNNVWAQAYHLFKSGFDFHLSKDDLVYSEQRNTENFTVTTSEIELINEKFCPSDASDPKAIFLTATKILEQLQNETKILLNSVLVGKALGVLKFERVQKRNKLLGYAEKGYYVIQRQCSK